MATDASHELPLHTAVSDNVPVLHDLDPDSVYPLLHVGEQLDPLASELWQGDAAPLVMAASVPLHGLGEQIAAVSVPASHLEGPETL